MTDMSPKDFQPQSRRMAVKAKGGKWAAHAVRLRVVRLAIFHENQTQFAKRLKVSVQRISNMENGYPLSIDIANKIRFAAPGMTLEWLYHGVEGLIPFDMLTRLRDEAAKPEHHPPQ